MKQVLFILLALFIYDALKLIVNYILLFTAKRYPAFMAWLMKKKKV
jgi:hypothetical protein